jgi:predicted signal transduction protein with EAL and GGDEF domain
VRTADTVARMGGDEFTVLLTHLDNETDAIQVAERIVEAVGRPVQLGDGLARVGASVGLSFYPQDGHDIDTLHRHADLALYEAKQCGRSQYRCFGADMLGKGNGRLSLSVQIDEALDKQEFSLVYQPIVDLATGRATGVEALIRWQRPDGTVIAPSQFIPRAEEAGLIKRIDSWVLERACRDVLGWQSANPQGLRVSVNLSAVSVQQPDMAQVIEDILQRTGIPPSLLSLEITETAVIANPDDVRRVLQKVVQLGVGLSLDDFGTGYSSLSYLTRFPINCIKLDRSFVERIGRDPASEEVIRSVLELSRKLNLHVVAEGIENVDQQGFLTRVGCKLMQGYHLARPMPGEQLERWLKAGAAATAA